MVRAADMHQSNVVGHVSNATLEPPGVTSKEQPTTQATAKSFPCSCGDAALGTVTVRTTPVNSPRSAQGTQDA